MAKLFVIAGHGAGDPGACSGGYSEANLVRQLASKLKARGGSDVQIGDTSVNWYASNYISKGKCPSGIPVIELHMDSALASAKGGHVIIKSGLSGDKYDNALAKFIGSFMPGRSKTLDGRSNLANPNRAYKMGVNYRLIECGFISNSGDRNKFINQMDDLADGILAAFGIKSSVTPSKPSKPTTSINVTKVNYTVKVTASNLSIRKGPGTNYAVVGAIKDKGAYAIVGEASGSGAKKWGQLKSGAGWISLDFCERVVVKSEKNAVYRLYNRSTGDHFYTNNQTEAQMIADMCWDYEGIAWYEGNGETVLRLYNPYTGEHFYTKSIDEHNALVADGWKCEGEGFREGSKHGVFRLYNESAEGKHHFTTDENEKNSLVKAGWKYEGVAFVVN